MNAQFFTCGLGEFYSEMADYLKWQVQDQHSIPLKVITEPEVRSFGLEPWNSYWVKCFLWDLAQKGTDVVVWLDCDIEVVSHLEYLSKADFAGVLDNERIANQERACDGRFNYIRSYFNMGFFSCTRNANFALKDASRMIQSPIHGNCIEQTWINYFLFANSVNVEVLPRRYNYLVGSVNPAWERPDDVVFEHYAGPLKKTWLETHVRNKAHRDNYRVVLEKERHMPQDKFADIRKDGEYILKSDMLIVRKDVLNTKSGDAIFTECGVSATIVETLPPEMVDLGEGVVACKRFKIAATKLTEQELKDIAEADAQRKAEQDAKDQAAAMEAAKSAAPPPGSQVPVVPTATEERPVGSSSKAPLPTAPKTRG